MDTTQTITTAGAAVPHVTAKVERGQRGGYGWTLGATVAQAPGQTVEQAFAAALDALVTADGQMRRMFGTAADGDLKTAA